MKQSVTIFILLLLTLLFPSCGEKADNTGTPLYKSTEISLPDGISFNWQSLCYSNGSLTLGGYTELDPLHPELDQEYVVCRLDASTGELVRQDSLDGATTATFELDSGSVDVKAELNNDTYDYMTIVHKDEDGNTLAEYDCEELFGVDLDRFPTTSPNGMFAILFAAEADGELYIVSSTGAVRIGGTPSRIDSRDRIMQAYLNGSELLVQTTDGIYTADFAVGEFKAPDIELPYGSQPIFLPEYKLGSLNNGVISGWRPDETGNITETEICNLYDSAISGGINAIVAVSEDELYAAVYDSFDGSDRLWRLESMTDDEAAQIELLTVGLVGSPDAITNHAIAEYNRTSENIRLRVVNYAPVVDDDGGYHSSSALDAFELDLVAGRIPDIMVIEADTGAKLSRLAGDRLFCDLYELMDKNGFDKSGLLSGITSYELVEGQSDEPSLYYFPLEVSISTFVGRASEFSERLTLSEFLDRLERLGDGQCLADYLRFRFALRCSLEEFIDYESGTTDFDSELFCRVAESYREYGDLYRNKAEYGNSDSKWQALADSELLLTNFRLSSNQLALCDAKYQFDDLTVVGYPDRDGSGILLEPAYFVGISADCENTDAAFGFLSLRLSDKYLQNSPNSIPYLTSATLDTYFENLPRWYYFSPTSSFYSVFNERKSEDTIGYMFPNGYIEYYLSDELCELMRGMIDSAAPLGDMDDDILSIIMEELDTYKSRPDMSASDAARIIESRVGTYYNENKD